MWLGRADGEGESGVGDGDVILGDAFSLRERAGRRSRIGRVGVCVGDSRLTYLFMIGISLLLLLLLPSSELLASDWAIERIMGNSAFSHSW
jgi:hypothetical protein